MTLDFFGQEEVVPTMIHILSILKSKVLERVVSRDFLLIHLWRISNDRVQCL
jgi:hypothetical protein